MLETCKDLKHHVSHWAHQGIEYRRRAEAERRYIETADVSELKNNWTVPESRSLEEMYGIRSTTEGSQSSSLAQQAFQDPSLRERLETLCVEKLDDPSMNEEQEREVNHEIEREQQVKRPPQVTPAVHKLHEGVCYFINHGKLPPPTMLGIDSLFLPFGSFGDHLMNSWSSSLYASTDFSQTLANSSPAELSSYMRPVNWIVQAPDEVLVVLSPFEVNELLPLIRRSDVLRLHVYAPRVSWSMLPFSNLNFYSIPSQPNHPVFQTWSQLANQVQLDIFAGQLYFSHYWNYRVFCSLLGIFTGFEEHERPRWQEFQIESDGFVRAEYRGQLFQFRTAHECKFTTSPIPMLKALIGHRRKGMQYLRTHVGQILHGRILLPEDF